MQLVVDVIFSVKGQSLQDILSGGPGKPGTTPSAADLGAGMATGASRAMGQAVTQSRGIFATVGSKMFESVGPVFDAAVRQSIAAKLRGELPQFTDAIARAAEPEALAAGLLKMGAKGQFDVGGAIQTRSNEILRSMAMLPISYENEVTKSYTQNLADRQKEELKSLAFQRDAADDYMKSRAGGFRKMDAMREKEAESVRKLTAIETGGYEKASSAQQAAAASAARASAAVIRKEGYAMGPLGRLVPQTGLLLPAMKETTEELTKMDRALSLMATRPPIPFMSKEGLRAMREAGKVVEETGAAVAKVAGETGAAVAKGGAVSLVGRAAMASAGRQAFTTLMPGGATFGGAVGLAGLAGVTGTLGTAMPIIGAVLALEAVTQISKRVSEQRAEITQGYLSILGARSFPSAALTWGNQPSTVWERMTLAGRGGYWNFLGAGLGEATGGLFGGGAPAERAGRIKGIGRLTTAGLDEETMRALLPRIEDAEARLRMTKGMLVEQIGGNLANLPTQYKGRVMTLETEKAELLARYKNLKPEKEVGELLSKGVARRSFVAAMEARDIQVVPESERLQREIDAKNEEIASVYILADQDRRRIELVHRRAFAQGIAHRSVIVQQHEEMSLAEQTMKLEQQREQFRAHAAFSPEIAGRIEKASIQDQLQGNLKLLDSQRSILETQSKQKEKASGLASIEYAMARERFVAANPILGRKAVEVAWLAEPTQAILRENFRKAEEDREKAEADLTDFYDAEEGKRAVLRRGADQEVILADYKIALARKKIAEGNLEFEGTINKGRLNLELDIARKIEDVQKRRFGLTPMQQAGMEVGGRGAEVGRLLRQAGFEESKAAELRRVGPKKETEVERAQYEQEARGRDLAAQGYRWQAGIAGLEMMDARQRMFYQAGSSAQEKEADRQEQLRIQAQINRGQYAMEGPRVRRLGEFMPVLRPSGLEMPITPPTFGEPVNDAEGLLVDALNNLRLAIVKIPIPTAGAPAGQPAVVMEPSAIPGAAWWD